MARAKANTVPKADRLHPGISDLVYHSDRGSLSSSGARRILKASPEKFHWELEHTVFKRQYDVGHLCHRIVLGEGAEIVVLDPAVHGLKKDGTPADNPRSTAGWQAAEAEARKRGATPVHIDEYRMAEAMAEKIRQHPLAAPLFDGGQPEMSGWWHDPITGVRLRYRPDTLNKLPTGRPVCVDYKTAASAHPDHFSKAVADFGYHQQEAWYKAGLVANGVAADPGFLFVVQEKDPPFQVSVNEIPAAEVLRGAQLNRMAIDIYAECVSADHWPGYDDVIHRVVFPTYARYREQERLAS